MNEQGGGVEAVPHGATSKERISGELSMEIGESDAGVNILQKHFFFPITLIGFYKSFLWDFTSATSSVLSALPR